MLKMYVGALQCREYVVLVLEEMTSWGMSSSAPPAAGPTQSARYECSAPKDFLCYHKGSGAPPSCMSQDGFSSEVDEQAKVTVDPLGTVQPNAALMCPFRVLRRPKRGIDPAPERATVGKGFKQSQMNRVPGGDDPRRMAVFRELDRRIAALRKVGTSPTPENIARLGGFIEHNRRRKDEE